MSRIFIVWSEVAEKAQAKLLEIANDDEFRVLRRGDFPRIQAEDIDDNKSLKSNGYCHCIVFELLD